MQPTDTLLHKYTNRQTADAHVRPLYPRLLVCSLSSSLLSHSPPFQTITLITFYQTGDTYSHCLSRNFVYIPLAAIAIAALADMILYGVQPVAWYLQQRGHESENPSLTSLLEPHEHPFEGHTETVTLLPSGTRISCESTINSRRRGFSFGDLVCESAPHNRPGIL